MYKDSENRTSLEFYFKLEQLQRDMNHLRLEYEPSEYDKILRREVIELLELEKEEETQSEEEEIMLVDRDSDGTLRQPVVDTSDGKNKLVTESDTNDLEKRLRGKLNPLITVSLGNEGEEVVNIVHSPKTEDSLQKYCKIKYGYNLDKFFTGKSLEVPEISVKNCPGVVMWLKEIYSFKYQYLLSDAILWPKLRNMVLLTFKAGYDKNLIPFVVHVENERVFDDAAHKILSWNELFDLLGTDIMASRFELIMEKWFKWIEKYPDYEEEKLAQVASLYISAVKSIVRKAETDWINKIEHNFLWEKMFPYLTPLLLVILKDEDEIVNCDSGFSKNCYRLFDLTVHEDSGKVYTAIRKKVSSFHVRHLRAKIIRIIKYEPSVMNGLNESLKWPFDVFPDP